MILVGATPCGCPALRDQSVIGQAQGPAPTVSDDVIGDGIYGRLSEWGYEHQSVSYARGKYARDNDGKGFHEVHVNTIEGFWSLLRSWLRHH